jgi:hypothetical protein
MPHPSLPKAHGVTLPPEQPVESVESELDELEVCGAA